MLVEASAIPTEATVSNRPRNWTSTLMPARVWSGASRRFRNEQKARASAAPREKPKSTTAAAIAQRHLKPLDQRLHCLNLAFEIGAAGEVPMHGRAGGHACGFGV